MKKQNYQEKLLIWKRNQIKLREKYSNTPAGFTTKQEAETALFEWQKEYEEYVESQEHKLSDTIISHESSICVGREADLICLHNQLAKEHLTFLYGIGGIGKSTIALAYMHQYNALYDHVLFITANQNMMHTICDDYSVSITNLRFLQNKYKSLRRYYHVKLQVLKSLCENKRILMIIDNYNIINDSTLDSFISLPCDKLFTTRINFESIPSSQKMHITALPKDKWELLIRSYSSDTIDAKVLSEINAYAKKINGHTLSIKLASKQALLGLTPDADWDVITLLSPFHLNKAEIELLLYLSILPTQGISKKFFLLLTSASETTLNNLRKYLLVDVIYKKNAWMDDNELLHVHPLIAEAVKKLKKPTCQNCSRLLRGFEAYMNGQLTGENTWLRTFDENRMLEPYIFALYETFPNPAPWLGKAFEEITTFLWIQGYYKEAEKYALKIYHATLDYYGIDSEMPGREALRVAAVYHNNLEHEKASTWYKKGFELLKSVTHRTFSSDLMLIHAYGKMIREARHQNDWVSFEKYFEDFQQLTNEYLSRTDIIRAQHDQINLEYHFGLLDKAKLLVENGKIKEARDTYEEMRYWLSEQDNTSYHVVTFNDFYVSLLVQEGNLTQAKEIAGYDAQTAMIYRGKTYKDYLTYQERLADVTMLCNQRRESLRIYEEILICLQNEYPYEKEWVSSILKKMKETKS